MWDQYLLPKGAVEWTWLESNSSRPKPALSPPKKRAEADLPVAGPCANRSSYSKQNIYDLIIYIYIYMYVWTNAYITDQMFISPVPSGPQFVAFDAWAENRTRDKSPVIKILYMTLKLKFLES